MAKESSGAPLPRRVPGAGDSPRPPARMKPPPLPPSLIERLRAAAEIAQEEQEEEAAHAGPETARPESGPARGWANSPDVAVPLPRRSPIRSDAPGQDQPPLPPSLIERLRAAAEIAQEEQVEEAAHAGTETARPETEPARGRATAPGVGVPRRPRSPIRPRSPTPPRSPIRSDTPGPDEEIEAAGQSPSVPEQVLPDDPTAPVPVISKAMHRDPVDSGVADIAAPREAPAQQDGAPPDARALRNGAPPQNGLTHREAPKKQDDPPQDTRALPNGAPPQNGVTHREAPKKQDGTAPQDTHALWNGTAPRSRPGQPDPPAWNWVDPATQERAGQLIRADEPVEEVPPASQPVRHRPIKRRPSVGRRLQIAGVVIGVLALTATGALVMDLSGHGSKAPSSARGTASARARRAEAVTRNLAAAWIAGQVSRTAVVSCDPVMCEALKSHGVPASDLDWIEPSTTSPLASAVIVATAAVRAQFGNLLGSVYAPGVIARFGSGQLQIEVRETAPHGAAAYRSALRADLADRKASGAGLLDSSRITASATARRQLITGQVDSRLIVMMAGLAAVRPIDIVAFGTVAPGGDPAMPLRFAEVTQPGRGHNAASRSASSAFVRSMRAFVRGQPVSLGVAQTQTVQLPGGLTVLRIQFGAPSPLGLLGPH